MTKTYIITDSRIDSTVTPSSSNPVASGAVYTALAGKQNAVRTLQVVLASTGWTDNTQTVSIVSVTADSILLVSPAPVSHTVYCKSDIYCSAQQDGAVTFTCGSVPEENVTVNVMLL